MARKVITADDIINEDVSVEADPKVDARMDALRKEVNEKLSEAKDKFTAVAIVGVTEDGRFDLVTNVSQYSYLQWLFNKASFELLIHEKNTTEKKAA